jgi:hypothetical protein
MLTILQRQYILEDVDERLSGCQPLLAIQQEITEPCISRFRECPRLTDSGKHPIDQIRLRLHPCDPTEHSRRRMAAIISLLMSQVFLEIVILVPLLMCSK